jgi:hypothetical protein
MPPLFLLFIEYKIYYANGAPGGTNYTFVGGGYLIG